MPRYFASIDFDPSNLDFDASDSWSIVAIYEIDGSFRIERTMFDFSRSIVGPHPVYNRIHTLVAERKSIDGTVGNILKPGSRTREISQSQFEEIYRLLSEKSKYMWKKKRRRPIAITENETDFRPKLP